MHKTENKLDNSAMKTKTKNIPTRECNSITFSAKYTENYIRCERVHNSRIIWDSKCWHTYLMWFRQKWCEASMPGREKIIDTTRNAFNVNIYTLTLTLTLILN